MKLTVSDASFGYPKQEKLYEHVNFELEGGDIISILGPNGAGKTTLIRAVLGFVKWTSGSSKLDGESIENIPASRLWSKISYVPQARRAAGSYTVLDSVLFGMTSQIGLFSTPTKQQIEKAEELLSRFHLTSLKNRMCNQISGGELQMVLIARALASNPGILILDEPESNLDFKNQMIVLDTLSSLASDGVGILFNTHYPEHALRRSNKAILLDHHEAKTGPTRQIITEENIESAFGVKTYIGTFETETTEIKNVIPIGLSKDVGKQDAKDSGKTALASISIICSEFEESSKINAILHEYNDILFGRMGMPHRKRNVYLINLNLDGQKSRIEDLAHQLSLLPDVSVKVTYAKED